MKLHTAALGLLAAASSAHAAPTPPVAVVAPYHPVRVRYDDVLSPAARARGALDPMLAALADVGLVVLTDLPAAFRADRRAFQASLGACAAASAAAQVHAFDDGTRRTTLASHTVPGPGGIQKMSHGDGAASCASFDAAAAPFRARVDAVTRAFAARVAEAAGPTPPGGLLATEDGHVFDTFHDVVDNGEHLEHFHEYKRDAADEPAAAEAGRTVEWHTDQGLLLAFVPGARVGPDGAADAGAPPADGDGDALLVRLADGAAREVAFAADDDLVLMLGDGVNQVGLRRLRAVPHALRVAPAADSARVWYGRMVLPPAAAVSPAHGKTFGRVRDLLAEEVGAPESAVHALGCSGTGRARQLEEAQCMEGSTYCWHRCMLHEDHGVSEEICGAQGLDVRCVNPRFQLSDNSHGDWFPGCIDAANAPNATEYDPLPDYPRSEEACTPAAHEAWVAQNAADFAHHQALPHGGYFYWTVEDGGAVRGMLSYDGLFGYLAYGWAGVGARNEMQQAHVVMAKISAEYSARYGFDLAVEPAVHLHWIGDALSLRHWQEPLDDWGASGPGDHEIVEEDCFTALKFTATGIHDRPFNLTGTDRLMWAANGEDVFGGYHGLTRAVFTVDWRGGGLEHKCSLSHGIDSCTGLAAVAEEEEEAALETGLPSLTETDAPPATETDAPAGGAREDKTGEVNEKAAASGLALAVPVAAVLVGLVSLV